MDGWTDGWMDGWMDSLIHSFVHSFIHSINQSINPIPSNPIQPHPTPSNPIQSHPIPSNSIQSNQIQSINQIKSNQIKSMRRNALYMCGNKYDNKKKIYIYILIDTKKRGSFFNAVAGQSARVWRLSFQKLKQAYASQKFLRPQRSALWSLKLPLALLQSSCEWGRKAWFPLDQKWAISIWFPLGHCGYHRSNSLWRETG